MLKCNHVIYWGDVITFNVERLFTIENFLINQNVEKFNVLNQDSGVIFPDVNKLLFEYCFVSGMLLIHL